MTATKLSCGSCGTVLNEKARFCSECGAAVLTGTPPAEYKQVTVLFADVVHSMDIAGAVGAERLREIMAALVNISATVVKRYGGTVDKFTDDGIVRASTPRTPQVEWWLASSRAWPNWSWSWAANVVRQPVRRGGRGASTLDGQRRSMRRKLNWPAGCMQAVSRRAR
jgi:class 3 adenylate cyclase